MAVMILSFAFCVLIGSARTECIKGKLDRESEKKCKGGYMWQCSHLSLNQVPKEYPKHNASSKLCLLDLSWNNLTTIPDNAFDFRTLSETLWLWLHFNNLNRIDSYAFSGLHNLIYINLSSNALDSPECFAKDALKPLRTLEHMNLKNNSIKSYVRFDGLFQPLKNLQGLLISGCYNCTFGEGFKNLTRLTSLSLSGSINKHNILCNISIVLNETFQYLPHLVELFMSFCNIKTVQPGALSKLKNLTTLDISYNSDLHFKGMKNVLSGLANSPICTLDVSAIHERFERGTVLREKHMKPIRHLKNLTVLYMELNKLEIIEEAVFDLIPASTSHFMLGSNRLTYGKYVTKLSNMSHIVYIDLSRQHLNYDPFLQKHQEHLYELGSTSLMHSRNKYTDQLNLRMSQNEERKMLYTNKSTHCFDSNKDSNGMTLSELKHNAPPFKKLDSGFSCLKCLAFCPRNVTCICAPVHLKYLLWRASFVSVNIYRLKICQPNSLRTINLSFNLIEIWEGPVYGLENLEELNLAENICAVMSPVFFDNFTNLLKLNVSYNFLGQVLDPRKNNTGTHFKNLKNLKILDLSDNRIYAFPSGIFESLVALEYLNIRRNMLTNWNSTLKTNYLKQLDLSDNKIETLSESFRNYLDRLAELNRTEPLTLNLSGNPIQCSCDNRPFLRWLSQSKVNIYFYGKDECHLQDGRRLQLSNSKVIPEIIDHLDTICVPYIFIGISIGVFFLSIGLCIIVYRYRWKLRHLYYSKRRRYKHKGYNRLFESDAFISYATTEAGFIKEKLVPNLEGDEHGLKVWVADRDAQCGASIAENLTNAIYSSKKSVLLLSRHYFSESWCNYEMNMARIESIESQRKLLIIVLFEDVSAKDMPLDYLRLLKSVESIEYPKHPQHQDTFWESLVKAINHE